MIVSTLSRVCAFPPSTCWPSEKPGTYGLSIQTLWTSCLVSGVPFWNQLGPRVTDSNGNNR